MTRKRKLTEVEDREEEEEEGAFGYERAKDPLQTAMEKSGIPALSHVEENEEAVDDPGTLGPSGGSVAAESSDTKGPPRKKRQLKFDDCMKLIVLECEWNMCLASFKKMERFCCHVAEHVAAECSTSTDDGHVCIWRECGYVCASKEELDRHVYFHAFHTKLKSIGAVLMNHNSAQCILDSSGRNMIPEIPEPFQCMWQDCDDKFASAQSFYWHVQSHVIQVDPGPNKNYVCGWQGCTSVCKNMTRLKDHSRSHTQEKLVGCPNCGGIYCSNTKFCDHYVRQIPLNLQQYQCSHCSTKFANVRLLRDHVRRHINHFKCSECEMTCATRATLLAHVRYRHSDVKPHKCPQCNKGFKALMDLNRHMTVHSDEPAFVCPFNDCEFVCRAQTTLNKHIKLTHNGMCKEPYACHMCDAKYSLGIFLTRHLIKVHSFHWPAGHSRFRYKRDEDGFYRLQTIRYESIELTQEGEENLQEEMVDSPDTMSAPPTPASQVSCASVSSSGPLTPRDCNQDKPNLNKISHKIEKILQLKHPSSPKHSEYQQIILPSEY